MPPASLPHPMLYPSTVIRYQPFSPSACSVCPFRYARTSCEFPVISCECNTFSGRSASAKACDGSNRFFFIVPRCSPGRSTLSPFVDGMFSGARYNCSPKRISLPSGLLRSVSFAKSRYSFASCSGMPFSSPLAQ